jgi:Tol biopolymer transport system component/plastocyanin
MGVGDVVRQARWVAAATALLGMACDDGELPTKPVVDTAGVVMLSDTVVAAAPSLSRLRVPHAVGSTDVRGSATMSQLAYVALAPGTATGAAQALIRNAGTGASVTVQVADGGFDPVGVAATMNDTLEIELRTADGTPVLRVDRTVPGRRRPKVVRTRPPRGKRDVALNATMIVVFSEPVDEQTLNASSVRLTRGQTTVTGRIAFVDEERLSVEFIPDTPLAAAADYQLTLTQDIRDLDGDPLEAPETVTFTTASPVTGPSQIAFWANGIRVMNADGSGGRNVTTGLTDYQPAWSPDGSRIAFTSDRFAEPFDHDIVVVNVDGTGMTQLTSGPDHDSAPAWSPDGTTIAFIRGECTDAECTSQRGYVYVMNAADGSGATRLEPATGDTWEGGASGGPTWSPDGSRIAFGRQDELGYDIWVMNSDGSNVTRLTSSAANDLQPAWSPDGSAIAFASDRDGNLDIYVMRPDGSDVTQVINGSESSQNLDPSWSPDGRTIAFFGLGGVAIVNGNGSGLGLLTSGNTPAWSPVGGAPTAPELFMLSVGRMVYTDTVLSTLSEPFRVKVLSGVFPAAGTEVSWAIRAGPADGLLSTDASVSDAGGVAAVTLTPGATAGTYRIEGSVPGASQSPVVFRVDLLPGKAVALQPISGNNQVGIRGTQLRYPLVVGLFDSHENEFGAAWRIRWETLTEAGAVPVPDNDQVTVMTLGEHLGQHTMRASLADDPSISSAIFTSFAVDAAVDVGWTDVGDCHFGFGPENLTVTSGQTVGWGWVPCDADGDGNAAHHDVTFEDDPTQPASSPVQNSGSHVRAFPVAGTYRYRCTLHSTDYASGEVGVVTVSP